MEVCRAGDGGTGIWAGRACAQRAGGLAGGQGGGTALAAAAPAVHGAPRQQHHFGGLQFLPHLAGICRRWAAGGRQGAGKASRSAGRQRGLKEVWKAACAQNYTALWLLKVQLPPVTAAGSRPGASHPPCTVSRRSQRNMPAEGADHSASPVRCCGREAGGRGHTRQRVSCRALPALPACLTSAAAALPACQPGEAASQPPLHTAQHSAAHTHLLAGSPNAGRSLRILPLHPPQVSVQPGLPPPPQRLRRHHLAQGAGAHRVRLQQVVRDDWKVRTHTRNALWRRQQNDAAHPTLETHRHVAPTAVPAGTSGT